MSTQVRKPTARICESCGRGEQWDERLEAWQIARDGGEKQVGNPHCIHEWDITGTFTPVDATDS
ncbi:MULTISPECIES: HEWD family protein [Natrinema]|uniref:HEWD domain-containing protein n=4 Tax=Natrinema TaxID=88723 RepID=L9ZTE8_NATA2|nr:MULTISPECIES: HEWD family protein [Natrinema]ELY72463.1 hypothetical protein C487_18628 [Natrinema pallidum DSM 3751]ELY88453.1 hypothetical protein C485_05830 [Natrinema altunense JCM 12890]QCW03687.1 hypothetical protein FGF80_10750 [Natrinema pallidum]RZH67369.1 hypothetical protein ELS17_10870 [Natrinema altunense]